MNEEEIPVLLSQITVMKKIPVMPEAVYLIKVLLRITFTQRAQKFY